MKVNKILKHLRPKKATGPDKIPIKTVKPAANIIDSYLTNIINNELPRNSFSHSAKVASLRPIFKRNDRTSIKIIDQLAF